MWTDYLTPLRLLIRGFLLVLLAVFGSIPTFLCVNRFGARFSVGRRQLDEFMLNWWTRMLCRAFAVKVKVSGTVLPGPVLIVSNHISWLDILVLHSSAAMGFVSKAEVARWPFIGFLAKLSRTVFHQRGSHNSASNVADAMITRLKEGGRVAIFPEGGIKPGDTVKLFHARLLKAAVDVECPIQPVMIRYVRNGVRDPDITFLDKENFMTNLIRLLGRPASVCQLRYLPPIEAAGRPRRELADQARAMVLNAFEAPVA